MGAHGGQVADPVIEARSGFDHRVGHLWSLRMTVEPFSIAFFAPSTIVARFQHLSQESHRWQGTRVLEFS